jgi:hypothetical protein
MVIAIIPPTARRPDPADLLLCWHHYRACRRALAAAGALLVGIDGTPVTGEEWPPATAERQEEDANTLSPSGR